MSIRDDWRTIPTLALIAAIAVVFLTAGCSGDEPAGDSSSSPDTSRPTDTTDPGDETSDQPDDDAADDPSGPDEPTVDAGGSECPCPDGFYCDLNTNTCKEGCTRDSCGQAASCNLESRTCECDEGHHWCGGTCVADDSPQHCGDRCQPCDAPTGGSATCNNGSCGVQCPDDQLICDDTCMTFDDYCQQCRDQAADRACEDDSDCCDGARCTADGTCEFGKSPGATCSEDDECAGEAICLPNPLGDDQCCIETDGRCTRDRQCCGLDLVCDNGNCCGESGAHCNSDADCCSGTCQGSGDDTTCQ